MFIDFFTDDGLTDSGPVTPNGLMDEDYERVLGPANKVCFMII